MQKIFFRNKKPPDFSGGLAVVPVTAVCNQKQKICGDLQIVRCAPDPVGKVAEADLSK